MVIISYLNYNGSLRNSGNSTGIFIGIYGF